MLTYISYIKGFFSVIVFNCIQPVNWESCAPVHVWLPPYINDAYVVLSEKPYQQELDYLLEKWHNFVNPYTWGDGRRITPRGLF